MGITREVSVECSISVHPRDRPSPRTRALAPASSFLWGSLLPHEGGKPSLQAPSFTFRWLQLILLFVPLGSWKAFGA